MKKLLLALMIVLASVTFVQTKVVDLTVVYQLDAEFVEFVTQVNLLTSPTAEGTKTIVATLDSAIDQTWVATGMDLLPGRNTFFFVEMMYDDVSEMSLAFPYKFTGRATIMSITRQK